MPSRQRREGGVSLIELMVALAIGSLLILALLEVFAASRSAYMLSSGLARTQENGRFAIDILQRDLRMAGHAGCVNDQARFLPGNVTASRPALISTFLTDAQLFADPVAYDAVEDGLRDGLRFDVAITGYEAVGTANGNSVTVAATPGGTTQAGWTGMPAALFGHFPESDAAGAPVPGSDVLVLRFFSPTGVQVTNFIPGDPATIEFEAGQADRLTEGLSDPGLFAIADCMQAAVFQATTAPLTTGTITVGTSGLNQSSFMTTPPFTTGQAMLYRAESLVYYVGLNANDNPALYRMRFTAAPGAGAVTAMPPEELVEGIESLQLEFGQDSNTVATQTPTGNIGSSVVASAVIPAADPETAWRRVGLVRVGLLARSTEPAAAEQRNDAAGAPRLSALGVRFVPPDDTRYRAVYEDTVALRNRLFGN